MTSARYAVGDKVGKQFYILTLAVQSTENLYTMYTTTTEMLEILILSNNVHAFEIFLISENRAHKVFASWRTTYKQIAAQGVRL